jgi:hypothetical protein
MRYETCETNGTAVTFRTATRTLMRSLHLLESNPTALQ